jgi:hypothetical protein
VRSGAPRHQSSWGWTNRMVKRSPHIDLTMTRMYHGINLAASHIPSILPGLKFEWHLAHEMLVNPNFVFETEDAVLGRDAKHDQKRLLRIFVKAMQRQREKAVRDSLDTIFVSTMEVDHPAVVEATSKIVALINGIRDAAESAAMGMRGQTAELVPLLKETLDAEFILQVPPYSEPVPAHPSHCDDIRDCRCCDTKPTALVSSQSSSSSWGALW